MKKIGITTTVPAEILIEAGYSIVDLNNIFIGSGNYLKLINDAEKQGFPRNTCAWIKGIFSACVNAGIHEIVGVVEGDCSNTKALLDVFKMYEIKVYPFVYPHDHKYESIKSSMTEFMKQFDVTPEHVEKVRKSLFSIRSLAKKIDELTYIDNKATGFENHLYQVSLSDFCSNEIECKRTLKAQIEKIEKRPSRVDNLRLGYIGVPPMTTDIYDYIEKSGSRIVYNEVQREFAFPRAEYAKDIFEQYRDYTYPYDIDHRLCEIKNQIRERKIDGIIHYVQAFCYRAIDDIVIKKSLDLPVLTIEGDRFNTLDARTKLRIDAFTDMLFDRKLRKS
jgi:benzoyl-CoA reductase/2-hydroxyglutaryl-CoA dehydratase subunit BcrC/BadD/HgdB